jgi:hypothetical protein
MRWLIVLALLLFHSPDGRRIWIVDSQIVAVLEAQGLGGVSPTLITTLSSSFFVRESAEDVAKQLGWKP